MIGIHSISVAPPIQLASMPQLAEARSREDDWTGINDAAARRRAQTRLNTRAYRKRKALAKKAGAANATAGALVKAEPLVEYWDDKQNSVLAAPASRVKQLYDARSPVLREGPREERSHVIFPLSADNLITLLQWNALRALAANRTLVSGILSTPLDCDAEVVHLTPRPADARALPRALQPTALQMTVPHYDWIDVFPAPELRDRLIRAAGAFDEDDLWADCVGGLYEGYPDDEVEKRGLIAWEPPWDVRGWEMSEGFLRKWAWLVNGVPGMLQATNRWRTQRGEAPLVEVVEDGGDDTSLSDG
ncbi:hypothetical protein GGR52DRAFT_5128 [Hypoxylon sp. FL1284]|nr:hypothetical protein GGR52DRAFT_5128 [Hypoxylon sp. FL1284]